MTPVMLLWRKSSPNAAITSERPELTAVMIMKYSICISKICSKPFSTKLINIVTYKHPRGGRKKIIQLRQWKYVKGKDRRSPPFSISNSLNVCDFHVQGVPVPDVPKANKPALYAAPETFPNQIARISIENGRKMRPQSDVYTICVYHKSYKKCNMYNAKTYLVLHRPYQRMLRI